MAQISLLSVLGTHISGDVWIYVIMTFSFISVLAYILEILEHGFKISKLNAGRSVKPHRNTESYFVSISSVHDLLL